MMRLLLAEDEKDLSNALVMILQRNKYSVDAVYNGQDAYDYIMTGNYDAIILDVMMPKMDGITVLKKIREQSNNVPVIILTAKSEVDDRVSGLDAGADDYLSKPFSTKELLARIRSITRRNSDQKDNVLKYGNIQLNRKTYQLSCDEKSEVLSNKEFQMLEMLMMNPEHIHSVDLFIEKIWGYESNVEQNIIWVYISNLRKKLSNMEANVSIKASRGLGYFLEIRHD